MINPNDLMLIFSLAVLGILALAFFAFAIAMTILLLNYNKYGLTQFGNTTIVPVIDEITRYKSGLALSPRERIMDMQMLYRITVDTPPKYMLK